MRRIGLFAACVMCVALGVFALSACNDQQKGLSAQSVSSSSSASSSSVASSSSASSSSSSSSAKANTGTVDVKVTNGTGYDISGVRIKPTAQEDYTDEGSYYGLAFANGTATEFSLKDVKEGQNYDVMLLTTADSKIPVRDIDLAGLKNITFRFEDGIGFITYTDPVSGEGADNRDEALKLADQHVKTYDIENQEG